MGLHHLKRLQTLCLVLAVVTLALFSAAHLRDAPKHGVGNFGVGGHGGYSNGADAGLPGEDVGGVEGQYQAGQAYPGAGTGSQTKAQFKWPKWGASDTPDQAALRAWELARATQHAGTGARVHRFLEKAARGEPFTVAAIGGSVSKGRGLTPPETAKDGEAETLGASTLYSRENLHMLVFDWLNTTFPNPRNRFVNGAQGGVGAGYFAWCFKEHITDNVDLVLVELGINDLNRLDVIPKYEYLIRRVLELDSAPAVINIETFTTLFPALISSSALHGDVLAYYDVPSLSIRDILLPRILAEPDKQLPRWFRTGGDVALGDDKVREWGGVPVDMMHISAKGHALAAGLIIDYLNAQLHLISPSGLWGRLGVSFQRARERTREYAIPATPLTRGFSQDPVGRRAPVCRSMNSPRWHAGVSGADERERRGRRGGGGGVGGVGGEDVGGIAGEDVGGMGGEGGWQAVPRAEPPGDVSDDDDLLDDTRAEWAADTNRTSASLSVPDGGPFANANANANGDAANAGSKGSKGSTKTDTETQTSPPGPARGIVLDPSSSGWEPWAWAEKRYLVARTPGAVAVYDFVVAAAEAPAAVEVRPLADPLDLYEPGKVVRREWDDGDVAGRDGGVGLHSPPRRGPRPRTEDDGGTVAIAYQRSAVYGLGSVFCFVDGARDRGKRIDGYWTIRERNMGIVDEVATGLRPGKHRLTCELLEETNDPRGRTEFRLFAIMHN